MSDRGSDSPKPGRAERLAARSRELQEQGGLRPSLPGEISVSSSDEQLLAPDQPAMEQESVGGQLGTGISRIRDLRMRLAAGASRPSSREQTQRAASPSGDERVEPVQAASSAEQPLAPISSANEGEDNVRPAIGRVSNIGQLNPGEELVDDEPLPSSTQVRMDNADVLTGARPATADELVGRSQERQSEGYVSAAAENSSASEPSRDVYRILNTQDMLGPDGQKLFLDEVRLALETGGNRDIVITGVPGYQQASSLEMSLADLLDDSTVRAEVERLGIRGVGIGGFTRGQIVFTLRNGNPNDQSGHILNEQGRERAENGEELRPQDFVDYRPGAVQSEILRPRITDVPASDTSRDSGQQSPQPSSPAPGPERPEENKPPAEERVSVPVEVLRIQRMLDGFGFNGQPVTVDQIYEGLPPNIRQTVDQNDENAVMATLANLLARGIIEGALTTPDPADLGELLYAIGPEGRRLVFSRLRVDQGCLIQARDSFQAYSTRQHTPESQEPREVNTQPVAVTPGPGLGERISGRVRDFFRVERARVTDSSPEERDRALSLARSLSDLYRSPEMTDRSGAERDILNHLWRGQINVNDAEGIVNSLPSDVARRITREFYTRLKHTPDSNDPWVVAWKNSPGYRRYSNYSSKEGQRHEIRIITESQERERRLNELRETSDIGNLLLELNNPNTNRQGERLSALAKIAARRNLNQQDLELLTGAIGNADFQREFLEELYRRSTSSDSNQVWRNNTLGMLKRRGVADDGGFLITSRPPSPELAVDDEPRAGGDSEILMSGSGTSFSQYLEGLEAAARLDHPIDANNLGEGTSSEGRIRITNTDGLPPILRSRTLQEAFGSELSGDNTPENINRLAGRISDAMVRSRIEDRDLQRFLNLISDPAQRELITENFFDRIRNIELTRRDSPSVHGWRDRWRENPDYINDSVNRIIRGNEQPNREFLAGRPDEFNRVINNLEARLQADPSLMPDSLRNQWLTFSQDIREEQYRIQQEREEERENNEIRDQLFGEIRGDINIITTNEFSRGVVIKMVERARELVDRGGVGGEDRERLANMMTKALNGSPDDVSARMTIGRYILSQSEQAVEEGRYDDAESFLNATEILGLDLNNNIAGLGSRDIEDMRDYIQSQRT